MTTPGTANSQEHFPFMKLPPEIRLMIYEFGIHDSLVTAISRASLPITGRFEPPAYLGALALVHSSSGIRKESRNAMGAIADRQWRSLKPRGWENYESFLVWLALTVPCPFLRP